MIKIKLGDKVRSSVQEDCMEGTVLGIKQLNYFGTQYFVCKVVDLNSRAYSWINSMYLSKVE